MPLLSRLAQRRAVIHHLRPAMRADSVRRLLLDILSHHADVNGARIVLVAERMDRLPIVALADRLDVGLQPLIREQPSDAEHAAKDRIGTVR